jgi:hypothetical protein
MTAIEWIVLGGLVAVLWITALWFFFVDQPTKRHYRGQHEEAESIRNEIARWREASIRTYERQGIRRNQ